MRVSSNLSLSLSLSPFLSLFFTVVLLREVCCKHEHDAAARRGAAVMLTDMSDRQGNAREGVGGEVAKGLLALQWGNLP